MSARGDQGSANRGGENCAGIRGTAEIYTVVLTPVSLTMRSIILSVMRMRRLDA